MITGRQIREARQLLRLTTAEVAARSGLHVDVVDRAESVDGSPPITLAQGIAIQRSLERDGVTFTLTSARLPRLRVVQDEP